MDLTAFNLASLSDSPSAIPSSSERSNDEAIVDEVDCSIRADFFGDLNRNISNNKLIRMFTYCLWCLSRSPFLESLRGTIVDGSSGKVRCLFRLAVAFPRLHPPVCLPVWTGSCERNESDKYLRMMSRAFGVVHWQLQTPSSQLSSDQSLYDDVWHWMLRLLGVLENF